MFSRNSININYVVLITASGEIVKLFISLCNKEVKFYFVVVKDYFGFLGKARF